MSTIKASQVFAAYRQSEIETLLESIRNYTDEYNSECEDIRRQSRETEEFIADVRTENAKASLVRLADAKRKARTLELAYKKNQFLNSIKVALGAMMLEKLMQLGASTHEESVLNSQGKEKKVLMATFPDGSKAKVPQGLAIDFSAFDRV